MLVRGTRIWRWSTFTPPQNAAHAAFCGLFLLRRSQQAEHFQKRARTADAKVVNTKNMVLYFLMSRGLKKIEGKEFTLRMQKNSQDSVEITDAAQVPLTCRELELRIPGRLWQEALAFLPEDTSKTLVSCIRDDRPSNDAIKEAVSRYEEVPGAQVKRGVHLRVA
jgi:Siphovirus Gp157